MKNKFKFLGIIALVAVIGFSMAGCKEEEPDIYDTVLLSLSTADYTTIFGTAPTEFTILSGTELELFEKLDKALDLEGKIVLTADNKMSWDQADGAVQTKWVGGAYITAANKTDLMNTLKNKGIVIGVIPFNTGRIGVAAAYKR